MWDVWRIREMHTNFWWENVEKRDRVENLDVNWRIVFKKKD
jgi:hypothetical protein